MIKNTRDFIEKSQKIHNNFYKYDKVDYKFSRQKVIITCPIHGDFLQTPNKHLCGRGCPKCKYIKIGKKKNGTTENFIKKAKQIHGNKYDYSLVDYDKAKKKVKIICKKHGIFEQTPDSHLSGQGCSSCGVERIKQLQKLLVKDFITQANKIHNNTYLYNLVEYDNLHQKVRIICKKHGVFEQLATNHLSGQGCPKCRSSKGETIIRKILKKLKINFVEQYKISKCKYKNPLIFDFAIFNDNNIIKCLIEFQGKQHYMPIKHFGGEKSFKEREIKDNIKIRYCKENCIILYHIRYDEDIEEAIKNIIFGLF